MEAGVLQLGVPAMLVLPHSSYRLCWMRMVLLDFSQRTFFHVWDVLTVFLKHRSHDTPLPTITHLKSQRVTVNPLAFGIISIFFNNGTLNAHFPDQLLPHYHLPPSFIFSSTCSVVFRSNSHQFHLPRNKTTVPPRLTPWQTPAPTALPYCHIAWGGVRRQS